MTFYKRINFSSSFIESVTTISFIFNSYRMKFYLERIEIVGRKFETFRIDSKFVNFSKSLDIEKKTIFPNFSNRENSRKEEKRGGGENENHGAETDFACYARRDKSCGQT